MEMIDKIIFHTIDSYDSFFTHSAITFEYIKMLSHKYVTSMRSSYFQHVLSLTQKAIICIQM